MTYLACKPVSYTHLIIDKRRPKPNVAKVMNIIGEVSGRTCVIMDDMVDTANTLCEAAAALKNNGALKVVAYATHPVLSGGAAERIANSELDELVVTNTIPLNDDTRNCKKIRQLSAAGILAETIRRISTEAVSYTHLLADHHHPNKCDRLNHLALNPRCLQYARKRCLLYTSRCV